MIARRLNAVALLCLLMSRTALAGEVLLYRDAEMPDPQQVASILSATEIVPEPARVRSLRLLPQTARESSGRIKPIAIAAIPESHVTSPTTSANAIQPIYSSVALALQFSFDSSRMSSEMSAQLDAVAEGIKLIGPHARIIIEGHTDASGSPEYNIYLSLKRASIVKEYMVRHHGIAPANLAVVGMGESNPLNKKNPYAQENRRVEFRAEVA